MNRYLVFVLCALNVQQTFCSEYLLSSAVTNYSYVDCSTWSALERIMPEISRRAEMSHEEMFLLNAQELREMTIAAFHLIWNMQDYSSAHKMLDCLEQSTYACPEIVQYLKGKLLFFQNGYEQAQEVFALAREITVSDAKRTELRIILEVIGSCNKADPDGIEFELLEAIVANDSANLLLKTNRVEAAIVLFEQALMIQQAAYKTTRHANVAYTLRCLANAYVAQGSFATAKALYEQALAIGDVVYSNREHPEVIALQEALQACVACL